MADERRGTAGFEVSTRLLGSNIQFRDGSTMRLGANHVAKKLFREARTGAIFDLNEMLSGHCPQAKLAPDKLVGSAAAAAAFEQGAGTGKLPVGVSFAPGVFGFRANDGMKDVERIDFEVEFTLWPRTTR